MQILYLSGWVPIGDMVLPELATVLYIDSHHHGQKIIKMATANWRLEASIFHEDLWLQSHPLYLAGFPKMCSCMFWYLIFPKLVSFTLSKALKMMVMSIGKAYPYRDQAISLFIIGFFVDRNVTENSMKKWWWWDRAWQLNRKIIVAAETRHCCHYTHQQMNRCIDLMLLSTGNAS